VLFVTGRRLSVLPVVVMACALAACGGGGGGGGSSLSPTPPTGPPGPALFPHGIMLQLDHPSPPVGTAATIQLTALAYDERGNLIKAGTYLPVITVASDDTSGQVTLGKTTITAPGDSIQVQYSGKLMQKPVTFSVASPVQNGGSVIFAPDPWTRYGPTTDPAVSSTAVGPDGKIWFTECGVLAGATCKLGNVSPTTGALTEFGDVGHANGLVAGPDGNVWFTEGNRNFIGRITTSGVVTEYPIPSGAPGNGSTAGPIVVGPDNNVWFAEGDRIGVVVPGTGAITEYPIGGLFRPSSLVVGPDGALWFGESQQIGRITTSGSVTQYAVGSPVGALVPGPSSIYFGAQPGAAPLWSISTSGVVNRSPLGPPGTVIDPVLGIAPGGVIWGTGASGYTLGVFTAGGVASLSFSGTWTLYLATAPAPFGSTVGVGHGVYGPDGNLWFVDGQGLARFRLAL
jgi:hypothetical protein